MPAVVGVAAVGVEQLGRVVPARRLPQRIDEGRGERMVTAAGPWRHREGRRADPERGGETPGVGVGRGVGVGPRERRRPCCDLLGRRRREARPGAASVVGRCAGGDERQVTGGGVTGEQRLQHVGALLGGQRPVDAEHDEAGQPVRQRATEGHVAIADGEQHAGRARRFGIERPTERLLHVGDAGIGVGWRGHLQLLRRRAGGQAIGHPVGPDPEHLQGVLEPDRHPALGEGGGLDRPRPRAGPRGGDRERRRPVGGAVQVGRSQRVEQVARPAGAEAAGERGPGPLGPRRVVERRPPLVPVPLGAGPFVGGERRFVGVEVHLVGEDADVQGGVGVREAGLDAHREQRDRHLAVQRFHGGLGVDLVQQPARRDADEPGQFGTPLVEGGSSGFQRGDAPFGPFEQAGAPAGRGSSASSAWRTASSAPNSVSSVARSPSSVRRLAIRSRS